MTVVSRLKWRAWPASAISALALASVPALGPARADGPPRCHALLSVTLLAEVPNPRDPGFLSSLAGDPGYVLIWKGTDGWSQRLELTGPAPDYRCQREIRRMRKDARVLYIRVVS
jgi:hypothetical protein